MKTIKVRISTEFRVRWRWCSCSDVGFVSSRLSIVESTGITTSKLHKRSDSPSQPSWNLTELFDTISANPCECHAATAGCKAGKKKETNRWRTWNGKDEPWKFCHFSKYTWECWNVEIMFKRVSNELYIFLRLFLYILYSLEILRRDRSGQYFFRSMHSSNSKLFYLIFPFFFRGKYLEPKGFTRGESTPKDETILQRSGVRGDEASCDILAPSSKIVSFERIANARVLFPRMRKVDSRDTR